MPLIEDAHGRKTLENSDKNVFELSLAASKIDSEWAPPKDTVLQGRRIAPGTRNRDARQLQGASPGAGYRR
jgi:hypothetical protein